MKTVHPILLLVLCGLVFGTSAVYGQDEALPEVPRTILLAHYFGKATSLGSSARFSLEQALNSTVSRIEAQLYIRSMEVTSSNTNELLAIAKDQGASLVLLMEYSFTSENELAAQVSFLDPEAGLEIKRIIGSGTVDERNRNLGPAFFEGLIPLLGSKIGPVKSSATIQIAAAAGTKVWVNGKEYLMPESTILELVTISGRYVLIESYLPGNFKTSRRYFIESRAASDMQKIVLDAQAYQNPFMLDSSMVWINYPTFQAWWPLESDRLYWGPGLQVFTFGFGQQNGDEQRQSLWVDLHLLEPGFGMLWYPFGKDADWRPAVGVKAFLRFDTASKYFLDILTPLVIQTNLGYEFKVAKEVSLYLDIASRLNVSLDSRLATSETQVDFDTKSVSSDFKFENISRMKLVLGPLLVEPFVPVFGIRLQL